MDASDIMDQGKSMNARNSTVNKRCNICNSIGASDSIDKGKSMDASNKGQHSRNTCNCMGASERMD